MLLFNGILRKIRKLVNLFRNQKKYDINKNIAKMADLYYRDNKSKKIFLNSFKKRRLRMKFKFLLLMTILVVVLTISLVVPLSRFQIDSLTKLSKDSTKNAISILAYNVGGNFYLYYTGDEKEKRGFVINLNDSLKPSKKEWKDADFISVIDRDGKIIADTRAVEIGKTYEEYKNMKGFDRIIKKQFDKYKRIVADFPKDNEKIEKEVKSLEIKLTKIPKSNDKEIESTETKINEYKQRIENLKKQFNLAVSSLNKVDSYLLNGLTESVFIDEKNSYTIIFPIVMTLGEKSGSFGTIVANISTDFIKRASLKVIVISISIAILVLILSIVIIQFYMRIIVQPIIYLTNGVKEVANGNLDMKVPVTGKDELAVLGEEFNNMIRIWREKLHMEKYVSKSTVKMISETETGLYDEEPKRSNITVFFSDVRGFTSYSEKHDPLDVVKNLNEIFDIQVAIIEKNEGDIDKFVGDEIMAVFPTPAKAFKAAVEIQKEMQKFNADRKELFEIGIGINSGDAVVGSIGSGSHFDWTAIGDTVNLGARLCGAAKAGKIVLSQDSFKKIKTNLTPIESEINVKGKEKSIKIYTF